MKINGFEGHDDMCEEERSGGWQDSVVWGLGISTALPPKRGEGLTPLYLASTTDGLGSVRERWKESLMQFV